MLCGLPRSATAVKVAQCVLSAATCVLLLALGSAWFGARTGRIAGWMWALYPNAVAFTHYLWSETLFTFLLLALLVALFAVRGGDSDGDAGEGPRLPSLRRCAPAGAPASSRARRSSAPRSCL